jgi:hypothetical protein
VTKLIDEINRSEMAFTPTPSSSNTIQSDAKNAEENKPITAFTVTSTAISTLSSSPKLSRSNTGLLKDAKSSQINTVNAKEAIQPETSKLSQSNIAFLKDSKQIESSPKLSRSNTFNTKEAKERTPLSNSPIVTITTDTLETRLKLQEFNLDSPKVSDLRKNFNNHDSISVRPGSNRSSAINLAKPSSNAGSAINLFREFSGGENFAKKDQYSVLSPASLQQSLGQVERDGLLKRVSELEAELALARLQAESVQTLLDDCKSSHKLKLESINQKHVLELKEISEKVSVAKDAEFQESNKAYSASLNAYFNPLTIDSNYKTNL